MRRALVVALALAIAVPAVGLGPSASGSSPPLPPYLAIGTSASPSDVGHAGWMRETAVDWDYAYQYLAAGVNTGNGWQTWNTNGQFPLWYAQDAAFHGYTPVFPYYMLLQSAAPACDGFAENRQDLCSLNDASLMRTYYDDFRTLMKRLGSGTHDGVAGFGGTAIVHVEPDLSGYAHQAVLDNAQCFGYCTGAANIASNLRAAVASTGDAELAGLADTWTGFNQALVRLRDLYAPNVLLAFHVSNWSAMHDVGSATYTIDANDLGKKVATFAHGSGVAAYDVIFNDVADRDAGFYKYVWGNANQWWDRNNVVVPHFHRWQEYVRAITSGTGKKAMVWQIPIGNQVMRSANNTWNHYQDNKLEYFFDHPQELVDAGIVGLLFGRGNDGSTSHTDAAGDGTTNPAAVCTADGTGGAETRCASQVAQFADDDGGYLRLRAQQYVAGGRVPTGPPAATTTTVPPPDTTPPPAPVITTPSKSSASTKSSTYTLRGTAEADAVVRVHRDDGTVAGAVDLAPGATSWAITVTLAPRSSTGVVARATDAAGNTSAPSRRVVITRR